MLPLDLFEGLSIASLPTVPNLLGNAGVLKPLSPSSRTVPFSDATGGDEGVSGHVTVREEYVVGLSIGAGRSVGREGCSEGFNVDSRDACAVC